VGPLAGLGALLVLGAGGITVASRNVPEHSESARAVPEPAPMGPPRELAFALAPEMGPPRPASLDLVGPPAPLRMAGAAGPGLSQPGPRGSIGFIGRVEGPLNTALPEGGVLVGPVWERKPLPSILVGPVPPSRTPGSGAAGGPDGPVPGSDISSELPDERTVALSRLAHPELQVRTTNPAKADEVSAEKPLSLHVAIKGSSYRTGEPVTARVSANAACYAALVRVDASGKATTVFQTARPSKDFTCLLKAGPGAGPEYLLAVASVQPLTAADLAAALRGAGSGFTAVKSPVEGGLAPAAAWSQAVALVDTLDGGQRKLQRFEWSSDTTTFVTQTAVQIAERPKARTPEPKGTTKEEPSAEPAPEKGEGSATPKAPDAKPENKPAPGGDSVLPK
jgi:hypothetical protein